jgi:hypothetical protein
MKIKTWLVLYGELAIGGRIVSREPIFDSVELPIGAHIIKFAGANVFVEVTPSIFTIDPLRSNDPQNTVSISKEGGFVKLEQLSQEPNNHDVVEGNEPFYIFGGLIVSVQFSSEPPKPYQFPTLEGLSVLHTS